MRFEPGQSALVRAVVRTTVQSCQQMGSRGCGGKRQKVEGEKGKRQERKKGFSKKGMVERDGKERRKRREQR